jgi:hypothetical protein
MTREVKNIFLPSGDDGMFVVIPANYAEAGVVPICISCIDHRGKPVCRGWIDAAKPIAEPLRYLARTFLEDIWRVSELAEGSVHALSARYGERLGRRPSTRIYVEAKWRAQDLAKGCRRARKGKEVQVRDHVLALLKEPHDFVRALEDRELMERLQECLRAWGDTDVLKMMEMYMSDSDDEIPEAFGVPPGAAGYQITNTLKKKFRRTMRRAFELFSNSDEGAA